MAGTFVIFLMLFHFWMNIQQPIVVYTRAMTNSTPSTPAPTRTQRKAEATRLAIIQNAEALLLEGGAAAFTLEAVAERADIAVQTIYNRIGGRSALLMAVAERAFEENKVYMDAAYAAAGTPMERLWIVAQGYFRFACERPNEFRLLADPPNEPEAVARMSDLIRHQNSKMEAALRDGIADGTIDPTIDPCLAATSLWAAANGILSLSWRADATPISQNGMEQLWAQWVSIVVKGISISRT
ncbi:hypothetical protein D9M71_258530 [compost metagenome]